MLVNDFGSINIDAELVVGVDSDVISLANGCVCCNIRDDLIAAVLSVIDRPERPEYILLEASGVADPGGIALTFGEADFTGRIRLDGITCVVDAEQVFATPEQMKLKLWQIAYADLLVLNKMDLVDVERATKIRSWLDQHFHRLRVIETSRCQVPMEVLLSCGRFDAAQLDTRSHEQSHNEDDCHDPDCGHRHHRADHAHEFSTWSYETDRPLSLEALREATAQLPVSIYRCKCVIHSVEEPTRRSVLQVVGKRVDVSIGGDWGDRRPRSRIVVIGARDTLDGEVLHQMFDRCRAM